VLPKEEEGRGGRGRGWEGRGWEEGREEGRTDGGREREGEGEYVILDRPSSMNPAIHKGRGEGKIAPIRIPLPCKRRRERIPSKLRYEARCRKSTRVQAVLCEEEVQNR